MEKIGKYRIDEKIGVGGFGEVFLGYDPFIKRRVAVKTCTSADSDITSRFFQEAEIAGNLHHKNVTTVYDFGVHEGLPFLIQEYLSGEDLDAKIKRRDYLPYPEKLYYLLQIARGLAHAHEKGVIHRDVKPANIRILEDGTAKIMDFGIARLAQQESGLTQTGMTVGTAAYLAPEQVRGQAVDVRTDVFSFGVLAYELMTYERPFQGEQISTVLYQLLNHEPKPLTELWPAAPAELVAIIGRCLSKDAAGRYAHGAALVKELETLQKLGRAATAPAEVPTPTVAFEPPARAEPTPGVTAEAHAPRTPSETARLDDASLAKGIVQPPLASPPTAGGQPHGRPRFSAAGSLASLLLLATLAAAAGWWYGLRAETPAVGDQPGMPADDLLQPIAGEPAAETPLDESPPEKAEEPAPDEPGRPEVTAEVRPAEARPAEMPTAEVPTAEVPTAEVPTAEQIPAEPPPVTPPVPTTGRLVLPDVGWTDAMAVRIDGVTYALGRERTLELKPGSYSAEFELSTGDYSPTPRSVEIVISAGESRRLAVAIPKPGALRVRPFPGRPNGRVSIDGQLLGQTPLDSLLREPGEYEIEIQPLAGGDGLTEKVTVETDLEVILTFDLEAGRVDTRTKPI